MPRAPISALLLAAALLAAAAEPAAAQPPADSSSVYRREVFRYDRRGRPDPFRPLLTAVDLGFRVDELRLVGVVYNPNPRLALAVFAPNDSSPRLRLRVGQRVGNITVTSIQPRAVQVRVDELGASRVETIALRRYPPQAGQGAPGDRYRRNQPQTQAAPAQTAPAGGASPANQPPARQSAPPPAYPARQPQK
jgi:hypothetical protein